MVYSIEPEYYIPIIPMILVNGGIGIGTGYSTNIAQYNPSDIISIYQNIITTINEKVGKVLNINDVEKSIEIVNDIEIDELVPYYLWI